MPYIIHIFKYNFHIKCLRIIEEKTVFTLDFFSKKSVMEYNCNDNELSCIKVILLMFSPSQRMVKGSRVNIGLVE